MITTAQLFNVVSTSIQEELVSKYYMTPSYETVTMNKASSNEVEVLVTPIIQSLVDYQISYAGGNFYKHSIPYLPHTDYDPRDNNVLNVVVPLTYSATLPELIIFDQTWKQKSITWSMHRPVPTFSINIGVKGCPYEYPSVDNLTGKQIPDKLFRLLSQYPKQCLFGLSGESHPFQPGSIILFDNRKIHCTSMFTGVKLGLSLRYKCNV